MNEALFPTYQDYLERDQSITVAIIVRGPGDLLGAKALIPLDGEPLGALLELPWGDQIVEKAQQLMQSRAGSLSARYDDDKIEIFFDIHRPSPKLIIVGAVHIADSLIDFAKPLGFHTYLVDPRTAFATEDRFPDVDELCPEWADEALPKIGLNDETAVVVITHDPKLDDPALKLALPSSAFYVGALGSRKTNAQRYERLLAEGMPQEQLDRLHAPIGINIGGRSPAEIGLSIMAEIIAARNRVRV